MSKSFLIKTPFVHTESASNVFLGNPVYNLHTLKTQEHWKGWMSSLYVTQQECHRKEKSDIMTQNVVWGGELSWDHSLCIPWDRSSLWVRSGINSQFKLDFYKRVTLGEQPEGRECLGLCHPSLAALYWWGSHPPQPQPPTLVFGVHKACLPMRAQLSEGEEEGVVELMT